MKLEEFYLLDFSFFRHVELDIKISAKIVPISYWNYNNEENIKIEK